MNLGADFTFPEEKWKDLANRIEGIITGQDSLFAYPEEIETLARRYARKIINYQGQLRESDVYTECLYFEYGRPICRNALRYTCDVVTDPG